MRYPIETYTETERALLAPHFTNLDRPVFALVNLPETMKGAMFARYSRYPGTLRQLFLEEFADDIDGAVTAILSGSEGERAADLYRRVFLGFGDDSVAQLGGAHIACEWVSNVMTKHLQRGRLAAYLEQSTRYIAYDRSMPDGGYRFWRDEDLGPQYERTLNFLFATYVRLLPIVEAWAADQFPRRADEPEAAHRRSIRAKALDLLRGLLPAASLSHVGIYATGQAYEQLILRLLSSPLPEARAYGDMILGELKKVMPSFVARVERPDRGGRWIEYLQERRRRSEAAAARLGLGDDQSNSDGPSVELTHCDGDETDILAAMLFESSGVSEVQAKAALLDLSPAERQAAFHDLVGERENRRHRPGRGFESVRYRFEIVSDYGAFRDLQRHRMLTVQWQPLSPDLGAYVPEELVEAGVDGDFREALERSHEEHDRLVRIGREDAATYALCLAYRIRYVMDMNAREAMHLIELRSGAQGHASYRFVAHRMHEAIADVHPAIADAMSHVDTSTDACLERMGSETRTAHLQAAAAVA